MQTIEFVLSKSKLRHERWKQSKQITILGNVDTKELAKTVLVLKTEQSQPNQHHSLVVLATTHCDENEEESEPWKGEIDFRLDTDHRHSL